MNNKEKYNKSFIDTFSIEKNARNNLEYNAITEWDSIGHMTLIGELEKTFDISIETDDIIDFSSYEKGIDILKKYKIEI